MVRVVRTAAAKRDLIRHFAYLAEHGNVELAERFVLAAENTFLDLARMPEMGAPPRIRRGKFAGVRLWRVHGFLKYLVVYRSLKDGAQIERVIHSAQDYQRVLR